MLIIVIAAAGGGSCIYTHNDLRLVTRSFQIFISHSFCRLQEVLYEDFHYFGLLQIKGWIQDEH